MQARYCGALAISSSAETRLAGSRLASSEQNLSVGIVGGGLAGLATAYNLIKKNPSVGITVLDQALPGTSGASAVAGGLLHPLTPRGKLAYMGLEGLKASKELIEAATLFEKGAVLRDEIYRMALNEKHEIALKEAARSFPEYMDWIEAADLDWGSPSVLGALRIHDGGCKVVHLPTYLKGLWSACKSRGTGERVWAVEPGCTLPDFDWNNRLSSFDTVVLSAGAGLFHSSIIQEDLPMKLVRGQSIELDLGNRSFDKARLCGKYAAPLPEENRVLIGATQEFKDDPLDSSEVEIELKIRSGAFTSDLWEGSSVHRLTEGFRVQSNRGPKGRIPMLGRYETHIHEDAWLFTGLSSRGLLYHALFADSLSDMILGLNKTSNPIDYKTLDWWQK